MVFLEIFRPHSSNMDARITEKGFMFCSFKGKCLNQEIIPEGSQLKISKNHEVTVGTVFNLLASAWILSSFS